MPQITCAGLTDLGRVRDRNEDDLLRDDRLGLFAVADGVGSRPGGDIAASLALKTLKDRLAAGGIAVGTRSNTDDSLSPDAERLLEAMHEANRAVLLEASRNDQYRGMATTLSAVLITGSTIIGANVGDSPIYLARNGEISRISISHSMSAGFSPEGYSEESATLGKKRGALTQAIGGGENIDVYVCEMKLFSGDLIVLCTDGLSDKVNSGEIMAEIRKHKKPEQACAALRDMANARGGNDNITVLVVRIDNSGASRPGFLRSLLRILGFGQLPR